MTEHEFWVLLQAMRQAQTSYFAAATKASNTRDDDEHERLVKLRDGHLKASRALEAKVDKEAKGKKGPLYELVRDLRKAQGEAFKKMAPPNIKKAKHLEGMLDDQIKGHFQPGLPFG